MPVVEEGTKFLGEVLAGTALRAVLAGLERELAAVQAKPTISRRSRREFSADPLGGRLDLGRIALAQPDLDLWPIVRSATAHDTPENALLGAALERAAEWASDKAVRYREALIADVFSEGARQAHRLRSGHRAALGELRLEGVGAPRLLPLAWERIALRQANPVVYQAAVEFAALLLDLVDPSRQLTRVPDPNRWIPAMLGGLNEANLQHVAFELWVANRFATHCRNIGFQVEYGYQGDVPFATAKRRGEEVEIWWQAAKPIVAWPSSLGHERERNGAWKPIRLRPDLVLTRRDGAERSLLCVECKNKSPESAQAEDLAQAFGYLAHYSALPACALVYRGFPGGARFRRKHTGQTVDVLEAPVQLGVDAGERLYDLLVN